MSYTQEAIIEDESTVEKELQAIGLSLSVVRDVALAAAAARAESLSVDPVSAPGWMSYMHGVRATRLALLRKGWAMSREGNVESTVNHELGIQLFFQNVDIACDRHRAPQAVSRKGCASRDLVAAGQVDMFADLSRDTKTQVHGSVPTVWVICVSVNAESIRAEVSCPTAFQGAQFEGFHQRLFAVNENFEPNIDFDENTDTIDDFDVPVSRKE